MIIFFKQSRTENVFATPFAVLDYTRSDDQYSRKEIEALVVEAGNLVNVGYNSALLSVFSLDYAVVYKHTAVTIGDALKTSVGISISNAPPELSSLVNIKQIVGQESALSLGDSVKKVVDAQNQFPYGVLIYDIPGPAGTKKTVMKKFMVYGTTYNFDAKRINSTLQIRGASFDSMVMRLQMRMNIDKAKPLVAQIQAALAPTGFKITAPADMAAKLPVASRYYPPAPVNKILANVCRDNGIFFDLDSDNKTVKLISLNSENNPAYLSLIPTKFSFRGHVSGSSIISTFSVQDYATATFKTEPQDLSLFDSVIIYNDSDASDLFGNFRADPAPYGLKKVKGYNFYILQLILTVSRTESTLTITGTNNWLISNFKLDTLFENAVYSGIR